MSSNPSGSLGVSPHLNPVRTVPRGSTAALSLLATRSPPVLKREYCHCSHDTTCGDCHDEYPGVWAALITDLDCWRVGPEHLRNRTSGVSLNHSQCSLRLLCCGYMARTRALLASSLSLVSWQYRSRPCIHMCRFRSGSRSSSQHSHLRRPTPPGPGGQAGRYFARQRLVTDHSSSRGGQLRPRLPHGR
jgi:hypothetical protein